MHYQETLSHLERLRRCLALPLLGPLLDHSEGRRGPDALFEEECIGIKGLPRNGGVTGRGRHEGSAPRQPLGTGSRSET